VFTHTYVESHVPSDSDAEEDVDGVGAGHVADRVVGAVVLGGQCYHICNAFAKKLAKMKVFKTQEQLFSQTS
jgi:hypothetical protein